MITFCDKWSFWCVCKPQNIHTIFCFFIIIFGIDTTEKQHDYVAANKSKPVYQRNRTVTTVSLVDGCLSNRFFENVASWYNSRLFTGQLTPRILLLEMRELLLFHFIRFKIIYFRNFPYLYIFYICTSDNKCTVYRICGIASGLFHCIHFEKYSRICDLWCMDAPFCCWSASIWFNWTIKSRVTSEEWSKSYYRYPMIRCFCYCPIDYLTDGSNKSFFPFPPSPQNDGDVSHGMYFASSSSSSFVFFF